MHRALTFESSRVRNRFLRADVISFVHSTCKDNARLSGRAVARIFHGLTRFPS